MPLTYPVEWKFEGFPHVISQEAHAAFIKMIDLIVEGIERQKTVYEDFKSAFGVSSFSSGTSWAETDMHTAMRAAMGNAARYVAAFYAGMEEVKKDGIAVPSVKAVNQLLAAHDIPLVIEPPELKLREGDITFVKEDSSEESLSLGFVMGKEIGSGGFGTVHRVTRKTKLGEYDYAMKVFNPSSFQIRERARERFIRELHALEKLQHRGIIPLLEAGLTATGDPYILMPLVRGRDVKEAMKDKWGYDVHHVFDEILIAMRFAHEREILHRDLKPENILVRESDRQPFILDFGAAYLLDEQDDGLTTTFIGTGPYAPPEFHYSPKNKSVKHDVFSLGVVIYEVIMGHRPSLTQYEPVGDRRGFARVDKVIQKAIAPENERYKDITEMWLDWCEFGRKLDVPF